MVVLLPLVLALIQVFAVAYARITLTAAATDGARYGATLGRGPADAIARAREQVDGALAPGAVERIEAEVTVRDGVDVVEVRVRATIRALGPWAPGVRTTVVAHAVVEPG